MWGWAGEMSRCTGQCCAVFYFPYTADEFTWKASKITDGAYIADMLIPLTAKESAERIERFGVKGDFNPE